jgi:hypothetical protein
MRLLAVSPRQLGTLRGRKTLARDLSRAARPESAGRRQDDPRGRKLLAFAATTSLAGSRSFEPRPLDSQRDGKK